MKKLILKFAVIIIFSTLCINKISVSQVKGYGFKGGVTLSYFYDNSLRSYYNLVIGTSSKAGFNAGLFVDIFSKKNFVVSSELYFNRKSGKSIPKLSGNFINLFPDDGIDFHLDYLDYGIPIRYNFTETKVIPYIYLAPRLSFYLGNKISTSRDSVARSVTDIISESLTTFGFGLSGGIGADFKLNQNLALLLEFQFSPDLFDTYYSKDFKVRSNSVELRTGLKFY